MRLSLPRQVYRLRLIPYLASICLAKQKSQAEQERKEREEKERQRLEEKRFRQMLPVEKCLAYTRHEPLTLLDSDYRNAIKKPSYEEEVKRIQSPESTGAACASDEEYAGSYDGGPGGGIHRFFQDSYDVVNVEPRVASRLPPLLRIRGRIVPVIVFDYIHETIKNAIHHVAVLRLTRPGGYWNENIAKANNGISPSLKTWYGRVAILLLMSLQNRVSKIFICCRYQLER
ncbi:hypothetical protein COOONC_07347, partial [Cooperia oncophora]